MMSKPDLSKHGDFIEQPKIECCNLDGKIEVLIWSSFSVKYGQSAIIVTQSIHICFIKNKIVQKLKGNI